MIGKWLAGATIALLLVLPGPARAQMDDASFLEQAIQINLAEIALGELAQEKTNDEAVLAYGQTMIRDHSAANEMAIALATQLGVAPPAEPRAKDQATYEALAATSEGFDEAFLDVMVQAHQEAVALFAAQAESDGETAAFAQEMLPHLQEHLEAAEALFEGLTN